MLFIHMTRDYTLRFTKEEVKKEKKEKKENEKEKKKKKNNHQHVKTF